MDDSLLARVVAEAPLGIIVLGADLSVRYMNPAARALHNLAPERDLESLKFDQIVTEPESVRSALEIAREDDMPSLIMPYEVGPSAPRRFISATVAQIAFGGDPESIVLIAEDITARKQFESELVETEKSSLLVQLIVTLQHEINNQLQIIVGQADAVFRSEAIDNGVRSNLAEIRRASQRIAARLRYLASLDRVETVQYLDHIRMINMEKDE